LRVVAFAAACLAGAELGHFLSFSGSALPTLWPPVGLLVGMLLISDQVFWPALCIADLTAILVSGVGIHNQPLTAALGIWCGDCLTALIGAGLVRRFVSQRLSLEAPREILGLILLAGLVASALGANALAISRVGTVGDGSYFHAWFVGCIATALGVLLFAPVVVAWSEERISPRAQNGGIARGLELAAYFVLLFSVVERVFDQPPGSSIPAARFPLFLLLPLLLWGAFRFEPRVIVLVPLAMTIHVDWLTTQGRGVIAQFASTVSEQALLLQALAGLATGLTLLISGSIERRTLVEEQLRAESARLSLAELEQASLIARLQQALGEIKTLRGLIPICAHCKRIRNDFGAWERFEAYVASHTEAEFTHGFCPDCTPELLVAASRSTGDQHHDAIAPSSHERRV
jgi:integral membrane sensor domain MASE1